MRISLFQKLFAALLLSSTLVIATMAILINASFKDGFQQYLNEEELIKVRQLATRVSSYYSPNHEWYRIGQSPHIWASLLQQLGEVPPPIGRRPPPPEQAKTPTMPKPSIMAPLSARLNLFDAQQQLVLGPRENLKLHKEITLEKVPITLDAQVIGYITVAQNQSLTNQLAQRFLQSQTKHLATISIAVIVLSLLFALVCARYLLEPLRALHKGANAVGGGDLDYCIKHRGNDEIADVTKAFNHLVASLKQQEQLRERWLSDISHELRTPLAVLRGELEAVQDEIRKPQPELIDSLHQQVLTLTRLVDDLRATSQADLQQQLDLQQLNLDSLLTNVVASYDRRYQDKQLTLDYTAADDVASIIGDKHKLTQLMNNLLENSYRYTDNGGEVKVALTQRLDEVVLVVEDSSPGVPDEALSKLSDRLYRVDQSRSREFGGSGLGLSICNNIIQGHQGTLMLDHSHLGGLKVTVYLPINNPSH